jgi:outer membrane protein TolC
MAAHKPSDTEAKINVLPEQIEQLLKDSEEERGKFLTVLKQVREHMAQIEQQAAQIQSLNSTVTSQKRQLEGMTG